MRGHVRQRGTGWVYVVDLPRTPDGTRKQKWSKTFRTQKEAQKALAAVLVELSTEIYVEPSKMPLRRYCEEVWLPLQEGRLSPTTFSSYSVHLKQLIYPELGGVKLRDLNSSLLSAHYAWLLRDGRSVHRDVHGPGLSPTSVRCVHSTLKLASATR